MSDALKPFVSLGNISDFLGFQLRNLQAVQAAQQKVLEGLVQITKQQANMLDSYISRATNAPPTGQDLGSAMGQQIEALKTSMLEAQANSNILTELMMRSSGEAGDILQTRLMGSLDEIKTAVEQAMPNEIAQSRNGGQAAVASPARRRG